MYARSTTLMIFPSSMDEAIAYMGDEVWPAMRDMDGCVGLSMMCDRESGRYIATSAWEDRQAMQASDQHIHPMREAMVDRFGAGVGEPEVREWEIAVLHRDHTSGPGAWVRATWVHVEPEQTNRLADLYRMVLLPQIVEFQGFCSASLLIDRPSGHAVSSVTFDSYEAMRSTRSLAAVVRERGSAEVDGEILEVDQLKLVLAHLRVPEMA
jgi:quinol monooxygenase YgiN